mmetsp:Transcript_25818/g.77085  ORF Transcript_25818/g.77085 Transcript_25818/m.77085 type:complete len:209 (-) Transcript_25818:24-650(-)
MPSILLLDLRHDLGLNGQPRARAPEDGDIAGGLLLLLAVKHGVEQVVHLVSLGLLPQGEDECVRGLHQPHKVAHGLANEVVHHCLGHTHDAALASKVGGQTLEPAVVHARGKGGQDLAGLPPLLPVARQERRRAVGGASGPLGVHEQLQCQTASRPEEMRQEGEVLQLPHGGRLDRQLNAAQREAAEGTTVRQQRRNGAPRAGLHVGH